MDGADKSSGESSGEETEPSIKQHNPSNRFDMRQRAILETYYKMGMVGTGKVYSFRHQRAASDVGCTVDKVKVQYYR